MNSDPIKVNETSQGPINGELSYPVDSVAAVTVSRKPVLQRVQNTPQRDNGGTADSVITGVTGRRRRCHCHCGGGIRCRSPREALRLWRGRQHGLFKITTGSATVPAVGAALLTDEAAPPANARMKWWVSRGLLEISQQWSMA